MGGGLSFHTITGCVGGFVLLAFIQNYQSLFARAQIPEWNVALQDSATALHPPGYSPTADADPSVRYEVLVPMPTRLNIERKSDRISVGFDLASPRKVKITVGRKMSIGVKYEMRVYAKGDARPQNPGSIGYASIKEPVTPSEPGFVHITTFDACSSFTRVTACTVAHPPYVGFIPRLRPGRFLGSDARKMR